TFAEIDHLEAAHRDIRLVAVLFPEQPLIHLRRSKGVRRDEIAAAREIADDGVGLRERAAVVELDGRHLTPRIELEEFRRAAAALQLVDLDPLIGQREVVKNPLPLQAVAGIAVAVDLHRRPRSRSAEQQAASALSTGQRYARLIRICSRYRR